MRAVIIVTCDLTLLGRLLPRPTLRVRLFKATDFLGRLPDTRLLTLAGGSMGVELACGGQVWSLTQFYSVDYSQSRMGVLKGVFNKRTIKVFVS